MMDQYTTAQAIAFHDRREWKQWNDKQIVDLQLYQDRWCVPFDRFHAAVEAVLGRPVWTHEFANMKRLQEEYEGLRPTATFGEILAQLPQEKVIILDAREGK